MRIYSALLFGALLCAFLVFVGSCGPSAKVSVTPKVDVKVSPTPVLTADERFEELGLDKVPQLFEPFDNGEYLQAIWKDPFSSLWDGGKTDFGGLQVSVKPFMIDVGEYVETPIISYDTVTFGATAGQEKPKPIGQPSPGGDPRIWTLFWHQISGKTEITGTLAVSPSDFVDIWDDLNGRPLTVLTTSYADVAWEVIDGEIIIKNGLSTIAAIAIAAPRLCALTGWCPQTSKTWVIDREEGQSPPDLPPTADFTAEPTTGEAPLEVMFDGSGSSDPDGDDQITEYAWWFRLEGETAGTVPDIIGEQVEWTFETVGRYKVTLRVYDGVTYASETITITVTDPDDPPENLPPTAVADAALTEGDTPLTVNFDGSSSSDVDGEIVSYAWSFGDDSTGTGLTPSHTYNDEGEYTVILTVTDDDDATGTDSLTITVTEPDVSPTWGGEPFDCEDVLLDVNPPGREFDPDREQGQQFTVDLFENGELRINGVAGKYFTLEWSTTAPSNALSVDGYFQSEVAGTGSYTVTATATLQTLPEPTVVPTVVNVTVI